MLALVHQHHPIDQLLDDLEAKFSAFGDGQTVGKSRLSFDANEAALAEGFVQRRRVHRFDADDAHRRLERFDRHRDAGDQPPAADRHDHRVKIGHVLNDLQPKRSLPGDDVGIVEAGDIREAFFVGEFLGEGFGVVVAFALQARPERRTRCSWRLSPAAPIWA